MVDGRLRRMVDGRLLGGQREGRRSANLREQPLTCAFALPPPLTGSNDSAVISRTSFGTYCALDGTGGPAHHSILWWPRAQNDQAERWIPRAGFRGAHMALAPEQAGIGIRRHFTADGVDPYDEVDWERRDARITNYRDGSVAFEQLGVEVPANWSLNATNILAQKYFRGTVGTPEREWSLKQVADRVVDTITNWGIEGGYFTDDHEAAAFNAELM